MAPKKKQEQQTINQIKVGRFQFKTGNFWLTVLCFLMVLMLGVTSITSYTIYKVLELYKDPVIQALIKIHQIKINTKSNINSTPIQTPQQIDNECVVIQQGSNQDYISNTKN